MKLTRIALALLICSPVYASFIINADSQAVGSLAPGERSTFYYGDENYLLNAQLHPEFLLPALPNIAGFSLLADASSIGATINVRLLTYQGNPVIDLGNAIFGSAFQGYTDLNGNFHNTAIATANRGGVSLLAGPQHALFEATCPQYAIDEGFAPSVCTGWFRVDFTNAGSTAITFTGIDPLGALPRLNANVSLGGVGAQTFSSAASQVPAFRGTAAVVPEPATWIMLAIGLAGIAAKRLGLLMPR
jgi:hypothetical protein